MIAWALLAALVVASAVWLARGIDRAAVDDGQLPVPLPLALRQAKQLRAARRWWR